MGKKVLIITGSPRLKGNTNALVTAFASGAVLYWHLRFTGAALHHRLKQRLTAFISLVFQREEKLYISKIYISLQHLLIQIRQCLMTLFMPMNSFVSYCILIREEHSFVRDLQEQMTSKIIRNF